MSNLAHEAIYMCHVLLQVCLVCHMHAQQQLNLQFVTHTRKTAAALISMTAEIPEGRQVLAQRRMSGRVAKIFTSERSDYLQVGRFCGHIMRSVTVFGGRCALPKTCTNSVPASQHSTTTWA